MHSFLVSPVLAAGIMDLRPGLSIWTALTFLLLLVVLSKFAWGPIVKMLDERERTIREAIEQAKRERAEAERMLTDQKASRAAAHREAAALAQASRQEVEVLRADLTAKARKEADELVASARKQIQEEKSKALDEKAQRVLVEEYIAQLPKDLAA